MRKLGVALALTAVAAVADTKTFSRGSLIVPMNSVFQTRCGQVSAYGLVYRILEANGTGHRNAASPVTVYIVNDPTKASVNRCKPTNTAVYVAAVSKPTDSSWSDGCDVSISNASEQPVLKVPYGNTFPTGGATFPAGPLNTYDDPDAWPRFTTFTKPDLTTPSFTKVSYSGAPFVIDAADAEKVLDLLNDGDTGTRPFPPIATSTFTTTCACNSSLSDHTTNTGGLEYSDACHYVDIHQSTVAFDATVGRRLNSPPASFALYDPSYGLGDTPRSDKKRASGGASFVLESYLKIAGLWLQGTTNGNDSKGCPVGNVSSCSFNGSKPAASGTEATPSQANRGVVFDRYTTEDLDYVSAVYPNGILNRTSSSALTYVLFWAPHWEGYVDSRGDDGKGVASVKAFLAAGGNILGECASIATWEDSLGTAAGGIPAGSNFLSATGVHYSSLGQLLTAANVGTGLTFSADSLQHNCLDPGQVKPCVDFPSPGNIFSQVGDWLFNWNAGLLEAIGKKSAYQPWTASMLTLRTDTGGTSDKADIDGYDVFAMGQSAADKGVVVYVGGHDVSSDPLGSRIVLNSMLNLAGVPLSSERALAGPTIVYAGNNAPSYVDQVLTPTYEAVSGYSANPAVQNFTASTSSNQKLWTWPYYPGHLRSHSMAGLSEGEQQFTSALLFDSSAMSSPTGVTPSPAKRNLFTWLGGYPKASPKTAGGGAARNNQLQQGWTPETLDGTTLTTSCSASGAACVDVMGYSARVKSPTYDDGEPSLHMVIGADGLCDVQQVMNYSKLNTTSDWGSASDCGPSSIAQFIADTPSAEWLLQRVRGYCYSGDNKNLTPLDSDCVDKNDNRAHLGGLVHSSAAVIVPSANIIDKGAPRPTVAFVGGYDGELHAFYIGGGEGYTGTAGTLTFNQDNNPAAKFPTDYSATFAKGPAPEAGTELWSFLPGSQLPRLESNTAQVDSSPVLLDAFADFDGSGLRTWHTLVLLSLGKMSTEVLALDVTNPLAPRLLWDNTGSLYQTGSSPKFSPNILMTDAIAPSALPGSLVVPKYVMSRSGTAPSGFIETLSAMRKIYDFQDLGGTAGLSSSQIRVGLEPVYVVFAVSNMPPGRQGIEVFAIEASTGQLMWQWERQYDDTVAPSDNAVPPVATVVTGADGAARVLFGDQEGRIWELDAATGRNLNSSSTMTGCSTTTPCQFAAYDTGSTTTSPQPITTNIALARVPGSVTSGASLAPYASERVMLFGTAGADWITSASVAGRVHVALFESGRRVPISTGTGMRLDGTTPWTLGAALTVARASGVLQEAPDFPMVFAKGERVYGTITVSGSVAYFATATARITDVMLLPSTVTGSTYSLNLGSATSGALVTNFDGTHAAYGGVAIYVNQKTGAFQGVVSSQTGTMDYRTTSSIGSATSTASNKDAALKVEDNHGLTYRLMSWLRWVLP